MRDFGDDFNHLLIYKVIIIPTIIEFADLLVCHMPVQDRRAVDVKCQIVVQFEQSFVSVRIGFNRNSNFLGHTAKIPLAALAVDLLEIQIELLSIQIKELIVAGRPSLNRNCSRPAFGRSPRGTADTDDNA